MTLPPHSPRARARFDELALPSNDRPAGVAQRKLGAVGGGDAPGVGVRRGVGRCRARSRSRNRSHTHTDTGTAHAPARLMMAICSRVAASSRGAGRHRRVPPRDLTDEITLGEPTPTDTHGPGRAPACLPLRPCLACARGAAPNEPNGAGRWVAFRIAGRGGVRWPGLGAGRDNSPGTNAGGLTSEKGSCGRLGKVEEGGREHCRNRTSWRAQARYRVFGCGMSGLGWIQPSF